MTETDRRRRKYILKSIFTKRVVTDLNIHLQTIDQGGVCCLWLVVVVEQEWVIASSPAVLVGDTPDGDTDTLGD